jgi:hypothetical protein
MDDVMYDYAVIWSGRYGDDPPSFCTTYGDESTRITAPARIGVDDLRAARWLAAYLSSFWPGEDYCYVVEGDEDEETGLHPFVGVG